MTHDEKVAAQMSSYISDAEMMQLGLADSPEHAASIRRKAKNGQWAKGVSGNPKGRPPGTPNKATALRRAFVENKAEDILDLLLGHACNDPATTRWVAARIFGEGNWKPVIEPGPLNTVDECRAAMDKTVDAWIAGTINENELHEVNEALVARMARLGQLQAGTAARD